MSTPPVQYGTPPPPPQMSGPPVAPINQLMMNYGPPSGQQYSHNMPPNMGPPSGPPPPQSQQPMLAPPQSPQQPLLPPPPPQSPQSVSPMNPMNGDYMGGGPPQFQPNDGRLNHQQVNQLRYQIMAYRLLARNQPIPEHITAAIQGKRMTPSPQMSAMTPPPPGVQQPMQPMGPPPPPPPQQPQQQQQQQWRPPMGQFFCSNNCFFSLNLMFCQ